MLRFHGAAGAVFTSIEQEAATLKRLDLSPAKKSRWQACLQYGKNAARLETGVEREGESGLCRNIAVCAQPPSSAANAMY